MAVIGIVPAAGHAARLGLERGSKEVLPVGGRPVMDHLVERMRLAGCDRLRIVTRAAKTDVIGHSADLGAEVVLGEPASVGASFELGLAGLAPDDLVLFGFPDTIWTPADGFVRLRARIEAGESLAVGLFTSPYPERSDVALLDAEERLVGVVTKSARPPSDLVYACLAGRVRALAGIGRFGEPGGFLAARARDAPIAVVRLGRVIDIGTPESLAEAERDPVFETG